MTELQQFLQLAQYLFRVWLEHSEPLFKCYLGVCFDELDEVTILSAFRIVNSNAAAAAFTQRFFERWPILKITRHMYLERHVVGRIVLCQNITEELRRVKAIILGQVFPKEFAAAYDATLPHGEKL